MAEVADDGGIGASMLAGEGLDNMIPEYHDMGNEDGIHLVSDGRPADAGSWAPGQSGPGGMLGHIDEIEKICFKGRMRVLHFAMLYFILSSAAVYAWLKTLDSFIAFEDGKQGLNVDAMQEQLEHQMSTFRQTATTKCDSGDSLFGDQVEEFEGHYYQFVGGMLAGGREQVEVTWEQAYDDAVQRCYKGRNGHLVSIESEAESGFLYNRLITSPYYESGKTSQAWIGAADLNAELDWEWVSAQRSFWQGLAAENETPGAAIEGRYTNWHVNEPNDSGHQEDCVAMYLWDQDDFRGSWNDMSCYHTLAFFVVEFDGPAR